MSSDQNTQFASECKIYQSAAENDFLCFGERTEPVPSLGFNLAPAELPKQAALSMAIATARQKELRGIVVLAESAAEAAVVEDIEVIPVASLAQAVGFFSGALEIEPTPSRLEELFEVYSKYDDDFADVRGQEMAKRAITIG